MLAGAPDRLVARLHVELEHDCQLLRAGFEQGCLVGSGHHPVVDSFVIAVRFTSLISPSRARSSAAVRSGVTSAAGSGAHDLRGQLRAALKYPGFEYGLVDGAVRALLCHLVVLLRFSVSHWLARCLSAR